ncbi:allophanate hydrolase, partial [Corallococcus coralloides]|nr:allophanate hydrolase [Corallococcus coralloides]
TPLAMWDIDRDPPALLQPGARVRFVDMATLSAAAREALCAAGTGAALAPAPAPAAVASAESGAGGAALGVVSAGLQTLFQDLGRHGHAGQGVSASGAMDRAACRAANRLVGNPSGAACLETVQGGLRLRSQGDTVVA